MQGDKYQSAHHNEQAATRAIKAIKVAGLTKFEIRTASMSSYTFSRNGSGSGRSVPMNSLALETSLNERGFFESSWFNFNKLNFKFSFYRYGSCD